MNEFIIASFRSRTQAIAFSEKMRARGIRTEIISTPSEVAIGCGLSVKLDKIYLPTAKTVMYSSGTQGFNGFYRAYDDGLSTKILH